MKTRSRLAAIIALGCLAFGLAGLSASDRASACALCDTYFVVNVEFDDVLYMRQTPSASGKIVGAIPYDGIGIVKVGGCVRRWCKMSYNGKTGYVNMKFLKFNGQ